MNGPPRMSEGLAGRRGERGAFQAEDEHERGDGWEAGIAKGKQQLDCNLVTHRSHWRTDR